MSRLEMIGEIRDMLPLLWEQGRFELAREVMGGIHQDDFTGVQDATVKAVWSELWSALNTNEGECT